MTESEFVASHLLLTTRYVLAFGDLNLNMTRVPALKAFTVFLEKEQIIALQYEKHHNKHM